jgi:PAS domain S-box-containing protein
MSRQLERNKRVESILNKMDFPDFGDPGKFKKHKSNIKQTVVSRDEYEALLKDFSYLKSLYSFYHAIVQDLSSGIITIDLSGRIIFLNRSAAKTLHFTVDDVLQKPLMDLCSDDHHTHQLIHQMIAERKSMEGNEIYLKTGDSRVIRVGFSAMPLNDMENQHEGMLIVFRDLTEVLAMRQQIDRMDRLATMGELSAGIAHEIRNPLAGIKTSAQVLQESFEENDFRNQLVTRIVREIDRSNNLLQQFFNFAKPKKAHKSYFDVELIIDSVYLLLAPRFKKKNIRFEKKFAELNERVYVDESQIEQIVLNLFLNALDAMAAHDEGTLTVQTRLATMPIQLLKKGEMVNENLPAVEVTIRDTGEGIDLKNIEKVFNPFFTTKSEGLGLGLSICNRLVNENGGKIEVNSVKKQGTEFRLMLPVKQV